MAKAKEMGIDAYLAEQRAKKEILTRFLGDYDDGTKEIFFCLAVNMLGVEELRSVLSQADLQTINLSRHDKAEHIEILLRECAAVRHIPLVLRPW